jgi:hypothetical protein
VNDDVENVRGERGTAASTPLLSLVVVPLFASNRIEDLL